jgi:hypothetical protein
MAKPAPSSARTSTGSDRETAKLTTKGVATTKEASTTGRRRPSNR